MQSWSSEEEAFAGSEKRTVHISKRMGEEEEEKEKGGGGGGGDLCCHPPLYLKPEGHVQSLSVPECLTDQCFLVHCILDSDTHPVIVTAMNMGISTSATPTCFSEASIGWEGPRSAFAE